MRNKLILLFLLSLGPIWAQQHSTTLSWTPGVGGDPATGFHVWKAIGTSPPATTGTPYGTVTASITTFVDSSVVAGQTATYVVTAFNQGGESVPSPSATCTTPFQAPTAPASLSVTAK